MKYLFSIVDNMIVERRKLSSIDNYRSSVFRWGATEGEFSFVFENIIEEFVSIELYGILKFKEFVLLSPRLSFMWQVNYFFSRNR